MVYNTKYLAAVKVAMLDMLTSVDGNGVKNSSMNSCVSDTGFEASLIRLDHDIETYEMVYGVWLQSAEQQLNHLSDNRQAFLMNLSDLKNEIHSLKGSSATLGIEELAQHCLEIERAILAFDVANTDSVETLHTLLENIHLVFDKSVKNVNAALEHYKSSA